jgi:pyruvate-ferredoxin/flavodoxin oxidoreductase
MDVLTAFAEARAAARPMPTVVGGRYGLSSKEFDPGDGTGGLREPRPARAAEPLHDRHRRRRHHGALDWQRDFEISVPGRTQAVFYGWARTGPSGEQDLHQDHRRGDRARAQGYFVYDSKKSGAITISHLRFGPGPIRSSYLVKQAGFVACHQFELLDRMDVLELAAPGRSCCSTRRTPRTSSGTGCRASSRRRLEKELQLHVIDAVTGRATGWMGGRINTVMQACFFALSGVLPRDEAIAEIKKAIEKTYRRRARRWCAEPCRRRRLARRALPGEGAGEDDRDARPPPVGARAPGLRAPGHRGHAGDKGDLLPVSAFPVDGTWPTATAQWEKRNLARRSRSGTGDLHPVQQVRARLPARRHPRQGLRRGAVATAPSGFKHCAFKGQAGSAYTVQVAPGGLHRLRAVHRGLPGEGQGEPRHKALDMLRSAAAGAERGLRVLPRPAGADRTTLRLDVKGSQFLQPLFEFSGACAGCGETPYIKLLTQLFGDRLIIANATGCSSIYGGNLPTTPYTVEREGRGPAWANSLFEDNAEFGSASGWADATGSREAALRQAPALGDASSGALLEADQSTEAGIARSAARVGAEERAQGRRRRRARSAARATTWCRRRVWIVGGDGWAYDIGYGGLDHVLATGRDVNILVLDTEVYSNTGGQQSKATPLGAAAKFAAAARHAERRTSGCWRWRTARLRGPGRLRRQDARREALLEAESYAGPSLIIAYSHCIAHGYDLVHGLEQQKRAVDSAAWPLYRFDPRRIVAGQPPLVLDSGPPKLRCASTCARRLGSGSPSRWTPSATSSSSPGHSRTPPSATASTSSWPRWSSRRPPPSPTSGRLPRPRWSEPTWISRSSTWD